MAQIYSSYLNTYAANVYSDHFIVDSSYKVNFYDIKHYTKIILNMRADHITATELKNGLTSMYILLPFPLIS